MTLRCKNCQKEIELPPYTIKIGGRKHCSKACYAQSQIGSVGARKGQRATAETKQKLSISQKLRFSKASSPFKGRKHTTEARAKISAFHRGRFVGENSPHWKGGKGTERHRIMLSHRYQAWRSQVFLRDNYTCQICDEYAGYLHADHIKSWAKFPELRYEVNNGRTLCRACHYYITFKRKLPLGSKWGIVNMIKKEG
jgi:hypothetical protein